jgi:hypothetical protein
MEHGKWRTATIASILLLIFTGAWGLAQHNARRATERTLTARYQERFFEAVSNVENIEVLITKGLLAITPERSNGELSVSLFSDLWRQAFAAQANLNQLPLVQGTLMRTSKFLTQIGDFGYYAARKIGAGEPFSQDELAMMQEFKQEAAVLNSSLREAQAKAARGIMPWSDIRQKTDRELAWRSQEIDDDDIVLQRRKRDDRPAVRVIRIGRDDVFEASSNQEVFCLTTGLFQAEYRLADHTRVNHPHNMTALLADIQPSDLNVASGGAHPNLVSGYVAVDLTHGFRNILLLWF